MLRLDALTLKQLRAFEAVVKHRSLTGAAEALNQTTPTIHSQIKNLEAAVGCTLLIRPAEGGHFQPTPEGDEMLKAARRVEAVLSQAAEQIRALSSGLTGHVTLGTVSTAKYFAPRLVRMLRDRIPGIEIALRIANREDTLDEMERGVFDLAIMGRPPRTQLQRAVPLGPHPHGIVLPPDHPLARADGFDPAQLMTETFLTREEGSGTRILMERFLDRLSEGYPARLVAMDSNETIKQAVIAGLGIAFLSLHTVTEELRSGRLVLLRGPGMPVMRHWYLIVPGAEPASGAAERVAREIEDLSGAYLPEVPLSV
ncbi:MAG: LysR family transcriptional regulator [Rhodobacteraceae bacterium]|nr:LysR family transcriptional regulator [Paracoccaceae bacterium]